MDFRGRLHCLDRMNSEQAALKVTFFITNEKGVRDDSQE